MFEFLIIKNLDLGSSKGLGSGVDINNKTDTNTEVPQFTVDLGAFRTGYKIFLVQYLIFGGFSAPCLKISIGKSRAI